MSWSPEFERLFGYSSSYALALPGEVLAPEPLKVRYRTGIFRFAEAAHSSCIYSRQVFDLTVLRNEDEGIGIGRSLAAISLAHETDDHGDGYHPDGQCTDTEGGEDREGQL